MIEAPHLHFAWLEHGFGLRDSAPPPGLTLAKQIHSARVLDACGQQGAQLGEGDAIVAAEPGAAIGIRTADCVPVLFADPVTRHIACAHAGWRGTAANIVAATVERMTAVGSRAEDLCVAIGPSIGPCCYEVSAETASHFDPWRSSAGDGSKPHLDLPAINETQLREAGVRRIWKSGECTYCQAARFYSYRREKEQAGRMLSFIRRLV